MRPAGVLATTIAVAACAAPPVAPVARTSLAGDSALIDLFARVAADTGVPADVLAAISWNETRLSFARPGGAHSHAFETGLVALTDGGARDLRRGASLAGVTEHAARTEPEASVRAGAALLREYARGDGVAPGLDFHRALRAFGGDAFAHAIDAALARGIDARDEAGRSLIVAARGPEQPPGFSSVVQAAGYPGAEWIPAHSGNYRVASRGAGDIKHIIIHDTEGSYTGTLSWFRNPASNVSAHYVIRSRDGHIAQMVDEKNIAYHIACFNTSSVGIEHEGYAAQPEKWFTEAMYVESAKLAAYLADKYNIEKKRGPIQGHGEAPDCSTHTDPGPGWNWPHYIDLVRTGGAPQFKAENVVVEAPGSIVAGEIATVTVTFDNTGTAAWDLDATRIGTQDPPDRESAFFVDGDWVSPSRATGVDARTAPAAAGTFSFQIRGPEVAAPTVFDESFSLVHESAQGATWFGPTFHLVIQVVPDGGEAPDASGCRVAGGGGGLGGVAVLAVAALRRRRRR